MKKNRLLYSVLLLLMILLSSCSNLRPIISLNRQNTPFGLSSKQIKQSIVTAAQELKWRVSATEDGLIQATYYSNKQQVDIDIPYSSISYSIIYLSSHNLGAANGQINLKYNQWIYDLNNRIHQELNSIHKHKNQK